MTQRLFLAALATLALVQPAAAEPDRARGVSVPLTPCATRGAGIEHVVPGAAGQRAVLGGAVTLYHVDRREPVSVPRDLAVVYDRGTDGGGPTCVVVGGPHDGFFRVDLSNATEAAPDKRGIATVTIGVTHYSPDGQHTAGSVTLQLGGKRITARVR